MSGTERSYLRITPRLLIILIVSALYILDIRPFTAEVISQFTGFQQKGIP